MAQTFTKNKLSASTNGKAIQVSATATAGTTIHTAVSGTTNYDEVYLYATNTSATNVTLTIEFGGTGTANNIVTVVPANSTILVIPGFLLQNSLVIGAFAGTTNVINITGYVHNIVNS